MRRTHLPLRIFRKTPPDAKDEAAEQLGEWCVGHREGGPRGHGDGPLTGVGGRVREQALEEEKLMVGVTGDWRLNNAPDNGQK